MDMSGRFVPTVDLTRDSDGTHSHMSDITLQLLASANAPSNNAALVRDLMQNVRSLRPWPNQSGKSLGNDSIPLHTRKSVLAVLGPQETVQLVAQRAREALNDQRETARRALPHQQG